MPEIFRNPREFVALIISNIPITVLIKRNEFMTKIILYVIKNSIDR